MYQLQLVKKKIHITTTGNTPFIISINKKFRKNRRDNKIHTTRARSSRYINNRFCAGLPAVPVLVRIGQGIVNRYTMRDLLETNNLLKIGGSAQKRKITISDELVTFVGGEEPFVQESDLRITNAWIARNVEPIKEFLKSRNLYRLIPDVDMLQAQQGQDDTEDDDE